MSREAMQMALEALESDPISHAGLVSRKQAITALRQALETEQEPVAWMHNFITGNVITHIPADIGRHPERWTALYKDPTPCKTCESLAMAVMNDQTYHEKIIPKRQWVGLSDEEIDECKRIATFRYQRHKYSVRGQIITPADGLEWHFAGVIEAKLKEKNT